MAFGNLGKFVSSDNSSYHAWEVRTFLKPTKEQCNAKATKHQAHWQQGSVGECNVIFHLSAIYNSSCDGEITSIKLLIV